MKINFSKVMLDLEQKPLKEGDRDLTLGPICSNALLMPFPDETDLEGTEKVKRFRLAEKLYQGGEVDVSPEEIVLIKKLASKAYAPLLVGRIYEVLDAGPTQ